MSGKVKGSVILVFIGLFIWLVNIGVFSFWEWGRDWPWILITIGLWGMLKYLFRPRRDAYHAEKAKAKVKDSIKEALGKIEKGEMTAEEAAENIKEKE